MSVPVWVTPPSCPPRSYISATSVVNIPASYDPLSTGDFSTVGYETPSVAEPLDLGLQNPGLLDTTIRPVTKPLTKSLTKPVMKQRTKSLTKPSLTKPLLAKPSLTKLSTWSPLATKPRPKPEPKSKPPKITMSSRPDKRIPCPVCAVSLLMSRLMQHVRVHQYNGRDNQRQCPFCPSWYTGTSTRRLHVLRNHGNVRPETPWVIVTARTKRQGEPAL